MGFYLNSRKNIKLRDFFFLGGVACGVRGSTTRIKSFCSQLAEIQLLVLILLCMNKVGLSFQGAIVLQQLKHSEASVYCISEYLCLK